jgi:GWxTD domain-containing protein
MKLHSKIFGTLIFTLMLSLCSEEVLSQQRPNMQSLIMANRTPSVYFDFVYTPAGDDKTRLDLIFRVNNDFLTFRRQNTTTNEGIIEQFISDLEIVVDIYDNKTKPVPDRPLLERQVWTKKVVVNEYERTQSAKYYSSGIVSFELKPDSYRIIPTISVNGVQVTRLQQTVSPRQNSLFSRNRGNETGSQRGLTVIPDLNAENASEMYLLSDATPSMTTFTMMNFSRNVFYAKDFSLLMSIPAELTSDSLVIELYEIGTMERSREQSPMVWSAPVNNFEKGTITLSQSDNSIVASFEKNENSQTKYATFNVPNNRFKNAWFDARLVSWTQGDSTHVSSKRYLSRWVDIPSSLLNLDFAIQMMHFILSEDELREMRRGSQTEREAKFRAYWNELDRTPDTDYNEIMAEYYRRVDHAYKEFTTPSKLGHESDQGKVYIMYGPPQNVERRLPASGNATEVWTYGSRTFIFTATTGFGDFRLVSTN